MMFGPSLRALLDQSAAPVLEFLQNQRQQMVNPHLQRVLEYLEGHLFSGFSRADLLRDLGLRHHQVANAFRETLGEPLMHFVRHRRLETAAHLLTFPEPLVSEVSELTGFKSNRSFPTAFRNWSGVTPSQFRKKAESLRRQVESNSSEGEDPSRILGETISFEAKRTLIAWTARDHPSLRIHLPAPKPLMSPSIAAKAQRTKLALPSDLLDAEVIRELPTVRKIWKKIQQLPSSDLDQQIQVLCRHQENLETPALFYWLREASRTASRDDRKLGHQLAKLALASAQLFALHPSEDHRSEILTQAWAWIGNQRRLQLDFTGAETAFRSAQVFMPESASPSTRGDFFFLKAELRWYQRFFDEALNLVDQAIALFRESKAERPYGEALIFRGFVLNYQSRPLEAASHLVLALDRINDTILPFQTLSARNELVRCYLELGETQKAEEQLQNLFKNPYFDESFEPIALALSGRIHVQKHEFEQAESKLWQARSQFLISGRLEHAALAGLDLAYIYASQSRQDQATLAASEAMMIYQRMSDRPEAVVGLRILRDGAAQRMISKEHIKTLRAGIDALLKADPTLKLDQLS